MNSIFEKNEVKLSEEKIMDFKELFNSVSFMFTDEVTTELYQFLMEVLKIAIEGPNEHEMASITELSERVRQSEEYRFLGFNFSKHFKLYIPDRKSKREY